MNKIIIGRFGQSYGIKGWLKVHSFTDPIDNILQYLPWQVQRHGQWQNVQITEGKRQGKYILVKIEGCDTPELAKTYTQSDIAIDRQQLPTLSQDEYYWSDLIGLRVINQAGIEFGTVDSLLETGANDVLVITGDHRRLLPYTSDVIKQIDLVQGIIIVNWDADF